MTKDYTNYETSKRLKELGFDGETDMWWMDTITPQLSSNNKDENFIYTPAYSVQTLLDSLPRTQIDKFDDGVPYIEVYCQVASDYLVKEKNLAKALCQMLIYCLERGLIKTK